MTSAGAVPGRLSPVDRRIIGLALPALGSLAVEPVYVLVDTAIVGRLGTEQLAGLAIAATVLSFVFAGGNFLTYGTTERVARRSGAGDPVGAADVGVQALWLAALVGAVVAPLIGFGARPLGRMFGAGGAVLDHCTTYLSISAVGVPFFLITLAAQGILRGVADYTTPLWVLAISNGANLVIEIVFVFGLDMGIAGSAWSTVLAQAGACVSFVVILRRRLGLATSRRPTRRGLAPLVVAGRHLLLRVVSMLLVFAGATAVAVQIDEPTLAAHQIVVSLFIFMALSLDALAVPAQTLVAERLGRDDVPAAAHVARRAVRLSFAAGVGLGVVVAGLSPVLPYVFTGDSEVTARASGALLWLAAALVPGAIAFAHDGVLIGAGDYRFLGRAALGYLVAVVPFAVVTLVWPNLGIAGIWGGLLFWMVLRAVVNERHARRMLV